MAPATPASSQFTSDGYDLKCNGYSRQSISDLDAMLRPRRHIEKLPKHPKAWWQAQLRLYGLDPGKSSTTISVLADRLKNAIANGLKSPPPDLVALEEELIASEREKRYQAMGEEERARYDTKRFLKERLCEKSEKSDVLVLKSVSGHEAHPVAESLGLFSVSADARGSHNRWVVVGRDRSAVLARKAAIEEDKRKFEEAEQLKKDRIIEARRLQMQAADNGTLESVRGTWSIKSDDISSQWPADDMKMCIYFSTMKSSEDSEEEACLEDSDEDGYGYGESKAERKKPARKTDPGEEFLWGSFELGVIDGILKSDKAVSTGSKLNKKPISFTWRGRETGEGEIQLGDENKGSITFDGCTKLKGVIKSSYGNFKLQGSKISMAFVDDHSSYEELNEDAYEDERVARWH